MACTMGAHLLARAHEIYPAASEPRRRRLGRASTPKPAGNAPVPRARLVHNESAPSHGARRRAHRAVKLPRPINSMAAMSSPQPSPPGGTVAGCALALPLASPLARRALLLPRA